MINYTENIARARNAGYSDLQIKAAFSKKFFPRIEKAIEAGYSYENIADSFRKRGIPDTYFLPLLDFITKKTEAKPTKLPITLRTGELPYPAIAERKPGIPKFTPQWTPPEKKKIPLITAQTFLPQETRGATGTWVKENIVSKTKDFLLGRYDRTILRRIDKFLEQGKRLVGKGWEEILDVADISPEDIVRKSQSIARKRITGEKLTPSEAIQQYVTGTKLPALLSASVSTIADGLGKSPFDPKFWAYYLSIGAGMNWLFHTPEGATYLANHPKIAKTIYWLIKNRRWNTKAGKALDKITKIFPEKWKPTGEQSFGARIQRTASNVYRTINKIQGKTEELHVDRIARQVAKLRAKGKTPKIEKILGKELLRTVKKAPYIRQAPPPKEIIPSGARANVTTAGELNSALKEIGWEAPEIIQTAKVAPDTQVTLYPGEMFAKPREIIAVIQKFAPSAITPTKPIVAPTPQVTPSPPAVAPKPEGLPSIQEMQMRIAGVTTPEEIPQRVLYMTRPQIEAEYKKLVKPEVTEALPEEVKQVSFSFSPKSPIELEKLPGAPFLNKDGQIVGVKGVGHEIAAATWQGLPIPPPEKFVEGIFTRELDDYLKRSEAIRIFPTLKEINLDIVGQPSSEQYRAIHQIIHNNPDKKIVYQLREGDKILGFGEVFSVTQLRQEINTKLMPTVTPTQAPAPKAKPEIAGEYIIPSRVPIFGKEETIVRRRDIAKQLAEKLNVPIRIGRIRQVWGRKRIGIYKPAEKLIRVKSPVDIRTISHEVGHFISDTLKPDLREYRNELESLTTRKTDKIEEGFAEFIAGYVTNPSETKSKAPVFYDYFENFLNNTNPEVRNVLLSARQSYERWLTMPASARVASQIGYKPERRNFPTIGRFYSTIVDELYPIKKYVDVIKKQGIKVLEEEDPFIMAVLHRGWKGKADTFLIHSPFDIYYNWRGKSLQDILKPVFDANALDDLDAYLVARRTIELGERKIETGIRIEDAKQAIKELEQRYPFFPEIAKDIYEYQNLLLQYARDSGLISNEAYNKMVKLNSQYVPFFRVMETAKTKGLFGRGYVDLPKITKKIRGSEREILPPTESIVRNTYAIIDVAERNQIASALTALAKKYPEQLSRLVEKIPPPIAKVATISLNEVKAQFKDQGLDIPDELADQIMNIFRPSIFKSGDNIIAVVEEGKRNFYQVDPDIYRALSQIDRESSNLIIKILSYPARWLRLGAVAWSPEFLARNPVRDAFTAFVYSKYGFIPGYDTFRGLMSVLGQDKIYWQWKMSGAEHAALVSLDRLYLQKNIRQLIPGLLNKFKNVVKNPMEGMRILAELGEEATRVGEFRLAMASKQRRLLLAEKIPEDITYRSKVMRAGIAAREITLDFSRLGSKTKAINQIIAFWNANVQGTDKMIREFKTNPTRALLKALIGITLPSITLYLAQRDDPRYKEIPQWQKDIFWIILTKKHIWRIPKPFELGILFGSVPERMLGYAFTKDPDILKKLRDAVARGISPGIIPTAFLAPIEVATNYSFFLERPIIPESLKRLPPELQKTVYTTQTAQMIADKLNVSPMQVEHFIRGYSGAFGKLSLDTIDALLRTLDITEGPVKPKATLSDIPIIRGFVVREPVGSASESLNKFYELYDKSVQGYLAIRQLQQDGASQEEVIRYINEFPELSFYTYFNKVARALSQLRKQRVMIWKSTELSAQEKRDKILEIEQEMTKIARLMVDTVEKRKK